MRLLRRLLLVALGITALAGAVAVPRAAAEDPPEPLEKGIKPDFELSPGQKAKVSNDAATFGDLYSGSPSDCRTGAPPGGPACVVYRLKLHRDTSPGALNFVLLRLDYEVTASPPDLVALVAGVNPFSVPNYNIYVYDVPDHYLGQNGSDGEAVGTPAEPFVAGLPEPLCSELCFLAEKGDPDDPKIGGIALDPPDIAGFTAKQDEYDVVVANITGPGTGFTLGLNFTNEKFAAPLEILEGDIVPIDLSDASAVDPLAAAPVTVAGDLVSLAPIGVDADYSGFGLGTRLDPSKFASVQLPSTLRRTAAPRGTPSTVWLVVWFVAVPLALMAGGAQVLLARRRRAFG